MKPKARLKITLKCDRACSYCINRCAEYRKRWTTITNGSSVKWTEYRSIIISGGEPTLDIKLREVARGLRIFTDGSVPIYLQTNGARLTKKLVKDMDDNIDGIGLSVHDVDEFMHLISRWHDILRVKPIRLYVNEDMYWSNTIVFDKLVREGFGMRMWKDGESDPTESIFVMEE